MTYKSIPAVLCVALLVASCSTPAGSLKAVASTKNSVSFEFKVRGCWGLGTGCFGISKLTVEEVSSARTMWEIRFPGVIEATVDYGKIPQPEQLVRSKYSNSGPWPEASNPGHRWASPLPRSADLLAIADFSYDSPWPSASVCYTFFRIEPDGRVVHLKGRSLGELYRKRAAHPESEHVVGGNGG
jgi:hypothetical protein